MVITIFERKVKIMSVTTATKTIRQALLILLSVTFAVAITACAPSTPASKSEVEPSNLDEPSASKSEVEPYLAYLGTNENDITLPEDLYYDRETVTFAGKEGSIYYEKSILGVMDEIDFADQLEWESNDTVTHEEFERFVKNIDKYFGYEATVKDDGVYGWKIDESSTNYETYVEATYSNGHAIVDFRMSSSYYHRL